MNVKKIAAVFAAAAIIGSASYSLTDHFILEDVVVVSAATTLRRNSTGSEVTKLQNNLIKLNYLSKGPPRANTMPPPRRRSSSSRPITRSMPTE